MTAAAARRLDVVRARRLTADLRRALSGALQLLAEVFEGRAWEVLGYPSWEDYCATELPELAKLRLPLEERRATVTALRGSGMSVRAIATPLGLSVGTVHADLKAAGDQLATVTSLDGRARPAAAMTEGAARPRLTNVARAVLVVREAGEAGVTVHQLGKRLRLNQCATSALLSRLARDGRLTYRAPAKRGQTGTYVAGPVGAGR